MNAFCSEMSDRGDILDIKRALRVIVYRVQEVGVPSRLDLFEGETDPASIQRIRDAALHIQQILN